MIRGIENIDRTVIHEKEEDNDMQGLLEIAGKRFLVYLGFSYACFSYECYQWRWGVILLHPCGSIN